MDLLLDPFYDLNMESFGSIVGIIRDYGNYALKREWIQGMIRYASTLFYYAFCSYISA